MPTPLFCMQLLKHVANAMQRAEGFVLERALVVCVLHCTGLQPPGVLYTDHRVHCTTNGYEAGPHHQQVDRVGLASGEHGDIDETPSRICAEDHGTYSTIVSCPWSIMYMQQL